MAVSFMAGDGGTYSADVKNAQDVRAVRDSENEINTILFRPGGWIAHWRCNAGDGLTDFVFEKRGDNVVVKIHNPTWNQTCERNVTITSNIVNMDGCNPMGLCVSTDHRSVSISGD